MLKVSVIIPAYNAEKTIQETVQSVQQQSFKDWELIIINDGSKDQTLNIVQKFKDSRIRIYSYDNGGLPVARNRGISHANGEFVTFLDADDLWTPDKLEMQVAALEKYPQAGVAYSWTILLWDTDKSMRFEKCNPVFFEGNVYSQLLLGNFIGNGSNILLRKQAMESVGLFEPMLRSCEDWDFYLRLSANWSFIVVPKHQIIYRKSSSSMTSKTKIMEEQGLLVIERAYLTAPPELQYLKNQSLANVYRLVADLCFQHSSDINQLRQAQTKLWRSIQLYPATILTKYTQKLVIRLIARKILPAQTIKNISQFFRSIVTMLNSRIET